MTPKEKAKELKEKCDGYACYAEVAVDEIIDMLEDEGFTFTEYHDKKTLEYWLEVKQEIEKL